MKTEIQKKHLDAKDKILTVATLLYAEQKIAMTTMEFFLKHLERIEDNPFSLLNDIISSEEEDKLIEVSLQGFAEITCKRKYYKIIEVSKEDI